LFLVTFVDFCGRDICDCFAGFLGWCLLCVDLVLFMMFAYWLVGFKANSVAVLYFIVYVYFVYLLFLFVCLVLVEFVYWLCV